MDYRIALASASLLILAGSAAAAEFGRTTIEGREIVLHDDGTWHYAGEGAKDDSDARAEQSADCQTFNSETIDLSFCVDPGNWAFSKLHENAEFGFQTKNQDMYFFVITEKASMEFEEMPEIILDNAQRAAGFERVEALGQDDHVFGGKRFGSVRYQAKIDGLEIVYSTFFMVEDSDQVAQFVFFTQPSDADRLAEQALQVMSTVQ